jgi:transcription-repair coupling factor (superfamily II helicase)
VRELLLLTRLKLLCRRSGIDRIDAGPQAIAVTFRRDVAAARPIEQLIKKSKGALAWRGERLVYARETGTPGERQRVTMKLVAKLAEVLG